MKNIAWAAVITASCLSVIAFFIANHHVPEPELRDQILLPETQKDTAGSTKITVKVTKNAGRTNSDGLFGGIVEIP